MIKDLLHDQQSHLDYYFDHLDRAGTEAVLEICLKTPGLLIWSGVGKSGIIAEKIAMTLVSTGTKALFLPPHNFLHGDLGIVSRDDTVILLSKSGETEELLNLIPFIRKKGAKIVALVSSQGRLARLADLALTLPVEKELCPFDLAPTISTEVQLLFGDVLAVALMKKKGFSLSTYAENHPGGTIGRKATVKVDEIMVPKENLPLCLHTKKLFEVLPEFSEKRMGCLLVVDEVGKFQGIFTDGDLRRALQNLGSEVMEKKLADLMTKSPLSIEKNVLAWEALKLMQKDPKRWIMVLPVLEETQVAGLVRMHDIIHAGVI